eukprot:3102025-Amphidinium_carterae.1
MGGVRGKEERRRLHAAAGLSLGKENPKGALVPVAIRSGRRLGVGLRFGPLCPAELLWCRCRGRSL